MRDIIFFLRANYIMGHFKGLCLGQFRGQKSLGPLEISREMAHYVVCPKPKKNNVPNFQKSAVHWYFYVPLRPEPIFVNVYGVQESIPKNFTLTFNFNVNRGNPAKDPRMAKKSAKVYHSLYCSIDQLQVAL
jgi:hypothetical protein